MIHEGEALLEYSDFYDYSSTYPTDGNEDEYRVMEDVNSQLILPSGARIGKRSLMRYFRYRKCYTFCLLVLKAKNNRTC